MVRIQRLRLGYFEKAVSCDSMKEAVYFVGNCFYEYFDNFFHFHIIPFQSFGTLMVLPQCGHCIVLHGAP